MTKHTYLLSESAKSHTLKQWRKMGGCGLSGWSEKLASQKLGRRFLDPSVTLGELQAACLCAGREIARFGLDHLKLTNWAVVEYTFPLERRSA